jgi:glycosyltransferase involved in cell wall biosynthesis
LSHKDLHGRKVCLITTNHISTNPRLIKEATSLENSGFNVHLVFTQHTDFLTREDMKILEQHPGWNYTSLQWSEHSFKEKSRRYASGLLQKFASSLVRSLPGLILHKLLLNRFYFFELRAALQTKADLFIAHNAGALAVAADAAMKLNSKFAFDAEDFHRGEKLPPKVIQSITTLEDHYLPAAEYISAASPLISDAYETLYHREITTINNVFPIVHSNIIRTDPEKLKLFWFSQVVGVNRGLQDVIRALRILESKDIEFHIYGFLPENSAILFEELIVQLGFQIPPKIIYHKPVSPDELLLEASLYDIGLAIEPGFCKNNEIALSNKLFTYLAGGNAIIFSNTPGQNHFYSMHTEVGFIYNVNDIRSLAALIDKYFEDRSLLELHKKNSKSLYLSEFNWEIEQQTFLKVVYTSFHLEMKNVSMALKPHRI